MSNIVHVVGTGTIGEPLIGLFTDFAHHLDLDEVTFHKRTPLVSDRARINHLIARGAKLATDADRKSDFEDLGHKVTYTHEQALERASVVIDCTPVGNKHKEQYLQLDGPKGFLAQGSEEGFGKPYARGVNDDALIPGEDRFVQIVSCNTHNITTLIKTVAEEEDGDLSFERGNFVCMRRANDITQADDIHSGAQRRQARRRGVRHPSRQGRAPGVRDPGQGSEPVLERRQAQHPIHALDLVQHGDEPGLHRRGGRAATHVESSGGHHPEAAGEPDLQLRARPWLLRPNPCRRPSSRCRPLPCVTAARSTASASRRKTATRCCPRWPRRLWLIDPDPQSMSKRLTPLRRWLYTEI